MYQLFKQTKTSIAVHIISISKSNSIYRTMTKTIQFLNLFFCVSSVTDSFNRVILHKERFIDSMKVNLRKKNPMDDRPYSTYQHGEGVVSSAWVPVQTPRYCSVSGWCRTGNRWPSVDVVYTNTMKLYACAMKLKTNNQYGDIEDVRIHTCDQLYQNWKLYYFVYSIANG